MRPPSQPEDDVEVRLDDQKAINTFGRLNTRLHELTEEIKEKRSLHDQLDDAANELILADDDEPVRCGSRLSLARRAQACATEAFRLRRCALTGYSTGSATSRYQRTGRTSCWSLARTSCRRRLRSWRLRWAASKIGSGG
jgi:hypothetical protein